MNFEDIVSVLSKSTCKDKNINHGPCFCMVNICESSCDSENKIVFCQLVLNCLNLLLVSNRHSFCEPRASAHHGDKSWYSGSWSCHDDAASTCTKYTYTKSVVISETSELSLKSSESLDDSLTPAAAPALRTTTPGPSGECIGWEWWWAARVNKEELAEVFLAETACFAARDLRLIPVWSRASRPSCADAACSRRRLKGSWGGGGGRSKGC